MNIDYSQSTPDASTVNLHTILCTDEFANSLPTTFLLHSGAVVSVCDTMSVTSFHGAIIKTNLSSVMLMVFPCKRSD